MAVHRGRGLPSGATREKAVRTALIGAGVSAIVLWWLTRPAPIVAGTTLPTPYFPPSKLAGLGAFGPEATTDCSSYMPASIDPSDDSAPGQLAAFGACSGGNALANNIISSSIVQSIESAIEEGSIQAAELTGLVTIATQMLTTVGISVAAATSVMPIVGLVLTAVLAIADWIGSLGGGPQIYVPNPNASGSDSISVPGLGTFEKINLSDYGSFVHNAMSWVNSNPAQALTMTPQQLSNQFAIFLTAQTPTQLSTNNQLLFALSIANSNQNVYAQLASGNPPPPGAYEILRSVQLPAAAAVCSSMPTKAGYLTNYGGTGGMGTAPLQSQFPALTTADMAAIFNEPLISGPFNTAIQNALNYVNAQCPPLMDPTVLTSPPYNLAFQDAVQALVQWAPVHTCSGYQAPVALPGPQQCISVPIPLGTSAQVCLPGPPTIVPGSALTVSTGGAPITTLKTQSTGSKIASTAAVAAGSLSVGLLIYKLYTGYSLATTLKSAWSDTKKIASKIKGGVEKDASKVKTDVEKPFEHKRRSNPLILSRRSSATGGRLVAYRIRMERDIVEFEGRTATLYRNDVAVAVFNPSSFQKAKIRSGQGEVLVFKDQLT